MNGFSCSLLKNCNKLLFKFQLLRIAVSVFLIVSLLGNAEAQFNLKEAHRSTYKNRLKSSRKQSSGGLLANTARMLFKYHQATIFGTPHTINVLPIVYFHFRTGVNLGFRTFLLANQKKPFLYRLTLQVNASLKGSHKHKLTFEYPYIGNSLFGVFVQAKWERDLQARYFGLGNNSSNKDDFTDPKNENFVDENYYLYNLKRPRLAVFGTRQIFPNVLFWLGFGLEKVEPQLKRGSDTSFLFKDRPFGFLGGSGRYLSFRLSWDTRSNEIFPTRGFLTELSVEPNFASVNQEVQGANGSEIRARRVTFYRYTFSDAHFIQLHSKRFIFANRMAFEAIAGEAPYYAYGDMAGLRRIRSLGGSQSLRGFQSRRFQDRIKFLTLTELRFNFKRIYLMEQTFDLIFTAFFDNGRVWNRWTELSLNNFHTTYGGGVWLNWSNRLIIRLDLGRSKEEIIPFFRLNSAF